MLKASQIDISKVTGEQIGQCERVFVGSVVWWKVHSETDCFKEYTVAHSAEYGFTCTCEAGLEGFKTCTRYGVCKHVRWALAAAKELREALAELEAKAKKPAPAPAIDIEMQARISAANERQANKPASRAKAYSPAAFSLLR